jgi:hypothetical protein
MLEACCVSNKETASDFVRHRTPPPDGAVPFPAQRKTKMAAVAKKARAAAVRPGSSVSGLRLSRVAGSVEGGYPIYPHKICQKKARHLIQLFKSGFTGGGSASMKKNARQF